MELITMKIICGMIELPFQGDVHRFAVNPG